MDDFEEELQARFNRDAEASPVPHFDPVTIVGRVRRARVKRNVTRGTAGLALVVALGILAGSLGGDRTPTVEIVQPTDGTTTEPTESLPVDTGEPSPSEEPTTGESEPKPPPKPEYVPPLIGGEGNSYTSFMTPEALVEEDTNETYDIYRQGPDGNVLVSVSDSEEIANGASETSTRAISRNGRYVVFWSSATNLTKEEGSGPFIRDLLKGTTASIRPTYDGVEVGGPVTPSIETAMSGDGRHIAFAGYAHGPGFSIFVHHLDENVTEVAWGTPSGAEHVDFGGEFNLSYSGRYVAVISTRSDVTENVCGTADCGRQAYLRDLIDGTTQLLSVAPDGRQGNGSSIYAYFEDDDRYAHFQSCATNLIDANVAPPPSPECKNGEARHYVRDLNSGVTSLQN